MQIKIFTIPVTGGEAVAEEMNAFLRTKKILQVEQKLVAEPNGSLWSFCVRYIDGDLPQAFSKERTDYRKELDEAAFARFTAMREVRKKLAEEEGTRSFFIFTDNELAELAKMEEITAASMKKVRGIGDKKIEKYGKFFFTQPKPNEKSQQPDNQDN